MYEEFFEMANTPFSRNVPADRLYTSNAIDDAIGRLTYAADRQLFAVVTADPNVWSGARRHSAKVYCALSTCSMSTTVIFLNT